MKSLSTISVLVLVFQLVAAGVWYVADDDARARLWDYDDKLDQIAFSVAMKEVVFPEEIKAKSDVAALIDTLIKCGTALSEDEGGARHRRLTLEGVLAAVRILLILIKNGILPYGPGRSEGRPPQVAVGTGEGGNGGNGDVVSIVLNGVGYGTIVFSFPTALTWTVEDRDKTFLYYSDQIAMGTNGDLSYHVKDIQFVDYKDRKHEKTVVQDFAGRVQGVGAYVEAFTGANSNAAQRNDFTNAQEEFLENEENKCIKISLDMPMPFHPKPDHVVLINFISAAFLANLSQFKKKKVQVDLVVPKMLLCGGYKSPGSEPEVTKVDPYGHYQLNMNKITNETITVLPKMPTTAAPVSQPKDLGVMVNTFKYTTETAGDRYMAHIQIHPPVVQKDILIHLCIVVDISGSMDSETGGAGNLTRLELAKCCLKGVVRGLPKNATLTIVTFSDDALTPVNAMTMDADGRSFAENVIDEMIPEDGTDLWAGLKAGFNAIEKDKRSGVLKFIALFTDGIPNDTHNWTNFSAMNAYAKTYGYPCSVDIFGFGTSLKSALLDKISEETGGSFKFIREKETVKSVFNSTIANIMTIKAKNVTLKIVPNAAVNYNVVGPYKVEKNEIRLGYAHDEQTRDIILEFTNIPNNMNPIELFEVSVRYTLIDEPERTLGPINPGAPIAVTEEIQFHLFRSQFVMALRKSQLFKLQRILDGVEPKLEGADREVEVYQTLDVAKAALLLWQNILPITDQARKDNEVWNSDLMSTLSRDISTVVKNYLSTDYDNGGKHELLSFATDHQKQVCGNNQASVVMYNRKKSLAARSQFDAGYSKAEEEIVTEKSRPGYRKKGKNPCFHGDSLVHVKVEGQLEPIMKPARYVRRGDEVVTMSKNTAKIVCVLISIIRNGETLLVEFPDGLKATPYHPVYDYKRASWEFPINLYEVKMVPCDAVFSFVLDREHSMMINGVPCVTLGHGAEGDIRKHEFFGTENIIDILKQNSGWEFGLIISKGITRDPKTTLANGLKLYE